MTGFIHTSLYPEQEPTTNTNIINLFGLYSHSICVVSRTVIHFMAFDLGSPVHRTLPARRSFYGIDLGSPVRRTLSNRRLFYGV